MARTISPETWAAAFRAFSANPDTKPRALGKLARAHGLRLPELRDRIQRERWDLRVRKASALRRTDANRERIARGRRQVLRDLEKLTPLLRSDKLDPRTVRALANAAYHAGYTLDALYSVGAWFAEARRDLKLAVEEKPSATGHPWGYGFPKMRRANWMR